LTHRAALETVIVAKGEGLSCMDAKKVLTVDNYGAVPWAHGAGESIPTRS